VSKENIQHYIVFVHGMADPRKNELLPSIISRFVEVREAAQGVWQKSPDPLRSSLITLGAVTSQNGKAKRSPDGRFAVQPLELQPWVEFDRIPQTHPSSPPLEENLFTGASVEPGRVDSKNTRNFRFLDVWWADIADADADQVWIQPVPWIRVLLARIKRQLASPKADKLLLDKRITAFHRREAERFLTLLEEAIIPIQLFMTIRLPQLYRQIFFSAFGDVQLYTEFKPCRGKSIRRFHDTLRWAHYRHYQTARANKIPEGDIPTPRFTIITHSLGTVLAIDALAYARANGSYIKDLIGYRASDWPKNAWTEADGKPVERSLPTEWIDCVQTLITLGSPISKFLALWPRNFRYLMDDKFLTSSKQAAWTAHPVVHFNFSEEQDPVGDRVSSIRDTLVYRKLFAPAACQEPVSEGANASRYILDQRITDTKPPTWLWDIIYRRSVTPGMAHVAYWTDTFLFSAILRLGIDQRTEACRLEDGKQLGLDTTVDSTLPVLRVGVVSLPELTPIALPRRPWYHLLWRRKCAAVRAQPLLISSELWRPKNIGDDVMAITYLAIPLVLGFALWSTFMLAYPALAGLDGAKWIPPTDVALGHWEKPESFVASPSASYLLWLPIASGLVIYMGKRFIALIVGWRRILTSGVSDDSIYPLFGRLQSDAFAPLLRWSLFYSTCTAFLLQFISGMFIVEAASAQLATLAAFSFTVLLIYLSISYAVDKARFNDYLKHVALVDFLILLAYLVTFVGLAFLAQLVVHSARPVASSISEIPQGLGWLVAWGPGGGDQAYLRRVLFIWLLFFSLSLTSYYAFGVMCYERWRDQVLKWYEAQGAAPPLTATNWYLLLGRRAWKSWRESAPGLPIFII